MSCCFVLLSCPALAWPSLELSPSHDNTLYETVIDAGEMKNELSNGAGNFLFAGRTGLDAGFRLRRTVLKFDLSVLPAGAEILTAELTLYQSKAAPGSPPATMGLYRLQQDWGEGTSQGIGAEGQGDFATEGDATWHHRFYPATSWDTAGGSFALNPSALVTVGQTLGPYTWDCTSGMLDDLDTWLKTPELNFGWVITGGEEAGQSAHRFNSRTNPSAEERPRLTIVYRPEGGVFGDGFESDRDCHPP